MEIIKDGTKGIRITCPYCNSELEYNRDDVKEYRSKTSCNLLWARRKSRSTYEYTSTWFEKTHLYIDCPVCGREITIEKKFTGMGTDVWDEEQLAKQHNMSVKQFRKYALNNAIYMPVKKEHNNE